MNLSAGRRTWEEATSPAAVLLAQKYERAWRDSDHAGRRPNLHVFLGQAGAITDGPGARLALLRADMALRWETGEKVGAQWYLERYSDLGEDTIVALVYEEFCLREEDDEHPGPAEYLNRYPQVARSLARVLQIHDLVGSGTPALTSTTSIGEGPLSSAAIFPEAGQTIGGFSLVEELGRGAFARVFLARERQLADRPVALKVTRRGSREPQTLARLQHTHIVPVYSHRIDAATGLHLLCMPYFGRVTLARILADPAVQAASSGVVLAAALDRLEPGETGPSPPSAGRTALLERSYPRAIAWWGARLAEALGHAHDRGVLHRDVKPSNVLVTADGMPMLLDFNLAREPVFQDETTGGEPILGGTIDYMPPEHLNALAQGSSEGVDSRADIYGLGVVLFEALTGKRPFASPRRGGSMVDLLNRAALDRLRTLPALCDRHPEIPVAFEAILGRCLEPEPGDRYQRASFLAADLQAVAEDMPLPHTREPWPRRTAAWIRRRRGRICAALALAVMISTLLAGAFGLRVERSNLLRRATLEADAGQEALDRRDYSAAKARFDAAANLAERSALTPWSYLVKLRDFRGIGGQLRSKFEDFKAAESPENLKALALEKSMLAERTRTVHQKAEDLFRAADHLRFQLLLDEGSELTQATLDLQKVLAPFFVLENSNWIELPHTIGLLDTDGRGRLLSEVNELLFLWMAAIDESAGDSPQLSRTMGPAENADLLAPALALCEKTLVWAQPKAPWVALSARLRASQALAKRALPTDGNSGGNSPLDEPREVTLVESPLACFQWGVLAYRADRLSRAIEWLERACRLNGGKNYWYQFLLGYLEDKAGYTEDAFRNYSVAAALRPDSPWLLFSLARIYRVRGQWYWARKNITAALEQLEGRPEATQVRLELAYLYQQVGDFTKARQQYDLIIAADGPGIYARAARLNLANIDAESGAHERARRAYDALILEDLTDTAARKSRALLELRLGEAERAAIDLTALLEAKTRVKKQDELFAERSLAFLLLGKAPEAVSDATEAQRTRPSPSHERLRQRALLAARRAESLQLERPEEVMVLPVGGNRLTLDLRAAALMLGGTVKSHPDKAVRAALNQAVICSALREHARALDAATFALEASPQSARAYLIRARVRYFAGDRARAMFDVDRGLQIQPNEPGLIELRGALQAAAGDARGALESYNQALHWGALGRIHVYKAAAFEALGRDTVALREWSLALRSDPELPEGYLGRARLAVRLKDWDLALADLEQAAAWAQGDPQTELAITAAYLRCLVTHPNRFGRWLVLAGRTIHDFRGSLFR
jgi:serine/threonine protein kinase/tetratricopeptide (TPR) repeat protein